MDNLTPCSNNLLGCKSMRAQLDPTRMVVVSCLLDADLLVYVQIGCPKDHHFHLPYIGKPSDLLHVLHLTVPI